MSSKFCTSGGSTRLVLVASLAIAAVLGAAPAIGTPADRFADVARIGGDQIRACAGYPVAHLAVYACAAAACRPIPFQVDARDTAGRWILDHGPEAAPAGHADTLDERALLLFMSSDAGDRARRGDLPHSVLAIEIRLHDPLDRTDRWAYLLAFPSAAPRSPVSYVEYDPTHDRVRGARVSLGFSGGIPDYLAISAPSNLAGHSDPTGSGPAELTPTAGPGLNLLDRLKVRASATFLFRLIHFSRSEADLSTEFAGWHEGPIRVIRSQRPRVRLGWHIRSPTFGSYTYFYRDFAELPVGLYLNFPPTYFFSDIVVRAILDFRDLKHWALLIPSVPDLIAINGVMTGAKRAVNNSADSWFALEGPDITLLNALEVSPSLATTRRRLVYRETETPDPPEAVPGEEPGIGYQLDQWEHVGAGHHELESISYALPRGVDPRAFMAARAVPIQVGVRPLED